MPQAFSLFLLVLVVDSHVLISHDEDFLVDLDDIEDLLVFECDLHGQLLEMRGGDVKQQCFFPCAAEDDGVGFLVDGDDGLVRLQLVLAHGFSGFAGDEAKVVAQLGEVEEVVFVEEDVVYLGALGQLMRVRTS